LFKDLRGKILKQDFKLLATKKLMLKIVCWPLSWKWWVGGQMDGTKS
jgi:hypothetical protein